MFCSSSQKAVKVLVAMCCKGYHTAAKYQDSITAIPGFLDAGIEKTRQST